MKYLKIEGKVADGEDGNGKAENGEGLVVDSELLDIFLKGRRKGKLGLGRWWTDGHVICIYKVGRYFICTI